MLKNDDLPDQVMVDPGQKQVSFIATTTDHPAFSEVDKRMSSQLAIEPVTISTGKGVYVLNPRDPDSLKIQREKRMGQSDVIQKRLISLSEEIFSDTDIPQVKKDELRLFLQQVHNLYSQQELKIKTLTEANEDLVDSFRGSLSSHFFVDEHIVLKRYFSGSAEENKLKSAEIGKPLDQVSAPIRFCALIGNIKKVIETGDVFKAEIKQETDQWFKIMVTPHLRHTDLSTQGAIISLREITTIKRIQKTLEDRNKSLVRINEDLDNFVYTTSGHLFDPLARLEGLIELLKVKVSSSTPDVRNVIDMIQNVLVQFKGNISELDEIGRIETEMLKTPDPVNFESLVEDLKFGIQDMLESAGATITTEFTEKQINFSKKSLRSIFYNLVVNAIQFKSPNRNLDLYISTYSVPGYIVLMVKDNGLGIPPEKMDSLFRRDKVRDAAGRARGLGLYLVKRIVDASGGKIEVDNLVNEGSVFRIFLRFDFHIH